MKEKIVITDVGPRDGLQNQRKILSIKQRVELIRAISAAGVPQIEVGSFVSPKAVPAMTGTDRVFAALDAQSDFTTPCIALIPNLKGYELARDAGAKVVSMVLYASNGMAQKNASMSMTDAENVTLNILRFAKLDGIEVIATIAVAFSCPFDGPSDPLLVQSIANKFIEAGVGQLVLADTIGSADPQQVRALTEALVKSHGASQLGCHFHDTRAMGLANVYAAVEAGIRRFDSSIAGLGGCPFAPGATGNVATDDVAMMLQQMGFDTGIDLGKLMEASDLAEVLTGNAPGGRSKAWLRAHLLKQAG
ncbi:MAG: hydroxymethylglutaryl-CoA lyase [Patiriisocius sp.]|jgi:hydroxymethylglutaryl-CoA lyase